MWPSTRSCGGYALPARSSVNASRGTLQTGRPPPPRRAEQRRPISASIRKGLFVEDLRWHETNAREHGLHRFIGGAGPEHDAVELLASTIVEHGVHQFS